ncbi:MAG: SulP family inorganic anion transporter, partial [Lentimicrobiaceae bacterium]|nr:SulP family inorganic anion transporter [Lentimicrobiaceae bacterium]
SQIKDFFGLSTTAEVPADFVEKWQFYIQNAGSINYYAFGIAVFTVLVSVYWPRINKRIPGTLIALILTTLAVTFFNLPVDTIGSRFGAISASFGSPALPAVSWATIRMLLAPAFTIAMLGAIESLLSAMVADGATGGNHRSNTELIAQGVANVVTPLFGGIPATGAIARTMTNIRNGGRTPMAGIIHALVLLLIMLFVGNLATLIPMSCLAGILVVVAYNMSEWRSFKGLLHNSKSDVAVLLVTFVLIVMIDLTVAIQCGLLLAVLLFIRRVSETSNVEILKNVQSSEDISDLPDDIAELVIPKKVEIFEVSGPFFFGVANKFEEAEKQLKVKPKILIIRLRRVPFMDSTALNNLRSFIKRTLKEDVQVILSAPVESVYNSLLKNNIHLVIGPENICNDVHAALKRAQELLAAK